MHNENTEIKTTIAKNVKTLMDANLWDSHQKLAKKAGIGAKTIGNLLNSSHSARVDTLVALADVFRVPVWRLLAQDLGEQIGTPINEDAGSYHVGTEVERSLSEIKKLVNQRKIGAAQIDSIADMLNKLTSGTDQGAQLIKPSRKARLATVIRRQREAIEEYMAHIELVKNEFARKRLDSAQAISKSEADNIILKLTEASRTLGEHSKEE